ncbi:MAG: hypothetical protein D6800_01025, partial [Candidatus Zixiibacteriota bacterium]
HDVRKFIVDTLGLIKSDKAVPALSQALWDESPYVVCSAAEALGEIGSPQAVPHLIAVAEKSEDARLQAVEALGKIGDERALPMLYALLSTDDPMILFAAIESLGYVGAVDSVERLKPFLDYEDQKIAETALKAIITISNKNESHVLEDLPLDRFRHFLFDGVKRGDEELTSFTLKQLRHWCGPDILRGLVGVLDGVNEDKLRAISEIMVEAGPMAGEVMAEKFATASNSVKLKLLDIFKVASDEQIAMKLAQFAFDSEPEVRQKIAHVLGISGWRGAIETLRKMTADPNGHVRAAAFSALGWLCDEEEIDFIAAGLEDSFPDIREAAAGAMIIIGGPKAVQRFTDDLYHPDSERQRLAVTALGWIGEKEVIEPLLQAVNHPEPMVRKSAIKALARMGQPMDIEPIVLALNDENSGVRRAAISALVTLDPDVAVRHVQLMLDDEDTWVRYHAISAVADLQRAELGELLLPFLRDENDILCIAAAKALAQLGFREALPALHELARENNADIAEAARAALARIGEHS